MLGGEGGHLDTDVPPDPPDGDGPSDPIEDAMYGVLWRVAPGPERDALLTLFGFARGLRDRVDELEDELVDELVDELTDAVEDALAELQEQEEGDPHASR